MENGHQSALKISKTQFTAPAEVLELSEGSLQKLLPPPAEAGEAVPSVRAPAAADDHRAQRAELEGSGDIGIRKRRDELRRMNERLRTLECEGQRLRLRLNWRLH